MATGKVSKSTVNGLEPGDRDKFLWDEDLRGFGVKITPRGRIVYLAQYRMGGRNSPTRRVTIAEHGKLTPMEARIEARKILGKASLKEDVAEARSALRKQITVAELADRYLDEHVAHQNKPSTQAEVRRIVKHRIKPKLGKLKIHELTRARIKEWHHGIRETPYEANRALAYLSKMMSLAAHDWDLLPGNPCIGLKRFPEHKRERFLSEEELSILGGALKQAEQDGIVPNTFASALRLLSFTGCRMSEILNLCWEDLQDDGSAICLADAKTGPRIVPLAGVAQQIFDRIERSGQYVFPAIGGDRPMTRHTFHRYWTRVKTLSGLTGIRPHDLRHTAGTYAAQAGFNAFNVRDFLGHRSIAMSARYVERAADPIRATADAVGIRISNALEGEQVERIANLESSKRRAGDAD